MLTQMSKWQLHDAKAKLSELIELALSEGPQVITRHGRERVVILSIEEFQKLEAAKPDFREYLLSGPKSDDFEIDRPRDTGRPVDL